jgi:hypothetical protein
MAMAKYTEISGKVLLNNLMELLDVSKKELATAFKATVAQLQVLATKDTEMSKTTILGRQLIQAYNICRVQSGDGAGPLRRAIEEVLDGTGIKFDDGTNKNTTRTVNKVKIRE